MIGENVSGPIASCRAWGEEISATVAGPRALKGTDERLVNSGEECRPAGIFSVQLLRLAATCPCQDDFLHDPLFRHPKPTV